MANTKNGIYYQDNYEVPSNVPEDQKKQAESIDKIIDQIKEDNSVNKKIVKITEDVLAETEYELPISYTVGSGNLKIFWENVLLEPGEEGNYQEVGETRQSSNKVKFGWNIETGETLIIELRGVLDEESA